MRRKGDIAVFFTLTLYITLSCLWSKSKSAKCRLFSSMQCKAQQEQPEVLGYEHLPLGEDYIMPNLVLHPYQRAGQVMSAGTGVQHSDGFWILGAPPPVAGSVCFGFASAHSFACRGRGPYILATAAKRQPAVHLAQARSADAP